MTIEPSEVANLEVYELRNDTSRVGLYRTVAGAQAAAEEIFNSYAQFEDDEDAEPLVAALKWAMAPESVRFLNSRKVLTAVYGTVYGTAFRIVPLTVLD